MKIQEKTLLLGALLLGTSCTTGEEGDALGGGDTQAVLDQYATVVQANYDDALAAAVDLQEAIEDFLAEPSEQGLKDAREAWLASRESYGQTEAFRFYDGPIDDPDTGPEGRINPWPLDESHIDYVEGDDGAGIINRVDEFPELDGELIADQNEAGGEETSISSGYHAIEFLLWGQDGNDDGPGDRPYTDYVSGSAGTADNQDRRGQYLSIVAQMLVDDLGGVAEQWQRGEENYRFDFVRLDSKEAVQRMLLGMGSLSGGELAGERMSTAYDNRDQEDEHSCFSDNTHRDLYLNALSIQNVYLGSYAGDDGPGIDTLVDQLDPELNEKLKDQLQASLDAIEEIPVPFDQALNDSEGRAKIRTAIDALWDQTDTIADVADTLGIQLNLQ